MAEIFQKTVESQTVMSLSFTGPYEQTPEKLDALIAWLLREGHPYSAPPLCIYYDDPREVAQEELRAEVCLPVEEDCQGDDTMVRRTLPGGEFACALHHGPYSGIQELYEQVFAWVGENGYRVIEQMGVREVFLEAPSGEDPSEEPVTEVQVPIEKAEAE